MKHNVHIILVALILMVNWTGPVWTASIEIPLPDLSGSYNSATRQAIFRFDRLPIQIYGVSIKLQGWTNPGWWYCDWGTLPTLSWRTYFTATMSDSTTGGTWRATGLIGEALYDDPAPFEFEVTLPFVATNDASWNFLEAGRGILVLNGVPMHVEGGGLSCYGVRPSTNVYLVTLMVNADCLIGTNSSTWGSIKAQFSR